MHKLNRFEVTAKFGTTCQSIPPPPPAGGGGEEQQAVFFDLEIRLKNQRRRNAFHR